MSLYGKYIAEREGFQIVESDHGFATYKIEGVSVYIRDIYVDFDHRKENLASLMADKISEIAKEQGCSKMLGSVCPSAKHSTESLKVLLAYGFKLMDAKENFISFVKEI